LLDEYSNVSVPFGVSTLEVRAMFYTPVQLLTQFAEYFYMIWYYSQDFDVIVV
jgi:hypothetical protein